MTLKTKFHGAAKFQIILVKGSMGIMAGDTIKNLTVPRINYPSTNRVSKDPLGLMATLACGITVTLEHCQVIRPVDTMTIAAHPTIRVFMGFINRVVPGRRMTGPANLGLIIF